MVSLLFLGFVVPCIRFHHNVMSHRIAASSSSFSHSLYLSLSSLVHTGVTRDVLVET